MSDMSVYLGDVLFNWVKGTAFAAAPTVYVALFNGDPEGAGTEVTGANGLSRQAPGFGAVASRAMSNAAEVNFGNASADLSVNYVVLYSAASGGNILAKKAISAAGVLNGQKVAIPAGQLQAAY